jgi:hypothetical protein
MKKREGKIRLLALMLTAAVLAGTGCSSSDKSESSAALPGAVESNGFKAADQYAEGKAKASNQEETLKNQELDKALSNGTAASVPSSGAGTGISAQIKPGQEGLSQKLIYKASLTMKVKNYSEAQSEIRNLVTLAGGYILQFSESSTKHEEGGQFVLKIPAAGFSSFLKDVERIPNEDIQQSLQAQDVSEEYVDLEARLKAKQVQETRYLEFMQKATRTDDLVNFTNELGKIQESIEQLKGRMRYIDQNVAYSTVEIRLYQPGGSAKSADVESKPEHLLERAKNAMLSTFGFLSLFGQTVVVLLAGMLPVLVILIVTGGPAWWVYHKRKAVRKLRETEGRIKLQEHNRNEAVKRNSPANVPISDTETDKNHS